MSNLDMTPPLQVQDRHPSVYFTALWLQCFNKELVFERLDLVEEYIQESNDRFIGGIFDDEQASELDCIERFLESEKSRNTQYIFTDR